MNDLKTQLLGIGLSATSDAIDDLIAKATAKRLSPVQIVEQIIATESADRARRSLERRMLRSRVGSFKPMADFDWNWPTKIDRPMIERALSLDFLRRWGQSFGFRLLVSFILPSGNLAGRIYEE